MKNEIILQKTNKQLKEKCSFILVSVFLFILLLTSCAKQIENNVSSTEIPTSTDTILMQSIKTLSLPTATLTNVVSTQMYPSLLDAIPIDITQMPALISTVKPDGDEYLYQNAYVTLKLDSSNGVVFLNLDNINDNSPINSDFLVYIDTGSMGTTFEIYPTNYARNYYSDKKMMDYNTCLESFPKTSIEESAQYENNPPIPIMIDTGNAYCFLTNEGRMAVINMIPNSQLQDNQGNIIVPMVVTVYSNTVNVLFIPSPTQTTGPSNRGITDITKINMLDESIQAFINAIANRDKSFIANMVLYPIYIKLTATGELIELKSQADFLSNFDRIFTEVYLSEISKATLENNVHSYPGIISLECKSIEIDFTDDGKIKYIYLLL